MPMKRLFVYFDKKDLFIVLAIIIVASLIAFFVNLALSSDLEWIPTVFAKTDWLLFFASYITGVFALIVGYLALSASNKAHLSSIRLHTSTIIRQESNHLYAEIQEELKQQNLLFNIIKVTTAIGMNDYKDLLEKKAMLIDYRAKLYERQIHWGFLKNLYLQSEYTTAYVKKYEDCWNSSVDILEDFLKLQIALFDCAQENDNDLAIQLNLQKQLSALLAIKKTATADEATLVDIENIKVELDNYNNKIVKGKQEFERIVKEIAEKIPILNSCKDSVFSASILLLSQISQFVFVKSADLHNQVSNIREK